MKGYQLIKLRERPEWKKQAAEWFASKWHLPIQYMKKVLMKPSQKYNQFLSGISY